MNSQKVTKKALSALLASTLVFSLMPTAAFAAQADTSSSQQKTEQVKTQTDKQDKSDKKDKLKTEGLIPGVINQQDSSDVLLEKMVEYGVCKYGDEFANPFWGFAAVQDSRRISFYNFMEEIKARVDKAEQPIDTLLNRARSSYGTQYINQGFALKLKEYRDKIILVRNQCNNLYNELKDAIKQENPDARGVSLKSYRNKETKLCNTLDSLNSLLEDDSVNEVNNAFERMVAESFIFANGPAFDLRVQFQQSIASAWIYGAIITSPLFVNPSKDASSKLNAFLANGKKINNIFNKEKKLQKKDVERFLVASNKELKRFVYCYPMNRFVCLQSGDDLGGWHKAIRHNDKDHPILNNTNVGFSDKKDIVQSPFGGRWKIKLFSEEREGRFGDTYATHGDYYKMLIRLPEGVALFDEFIAHGLNKKQDGTHLYNESSFKDRGRLVFGENFTHNYGDWSQSIHTWYMDLFDTKQKKIRPGNLSFGSTGEVVFKSQIYRKIHDVRTKVDPAELFVLSKL